MLVDGHIVATLSPGQAFNEYLMAAGVQHTLVFRIATTSAAACAAEMPVPIACIDKIWSCSG